ncbi:MAG TPA: hypothetical protein VNS58_20810 [Puia sp.]|nr:hypothetical protein [Puia sp.]
MQGQVDIQALAKNKMDESHCLFVNGFYDGAYYLGGYVIELLLKARICKTLGVDDFFVFNRAKKELYKPYKVHNFEELLLLSGIHTDFLNAKDNSDFKSYWSEVGNWNEDSRYLKGKTFQDVKFFLISVEEIAKWIKKYL